MCTTIYKCTISITEKYITEKLNCAQLEKKSHQNFVTHNLQCWVSYRESVFILRPLHAVIVRLWSICRCIYTVDAQYILSTKQDKIKWNTDIIINESPIFSLFCLISPLHITCRNHSHFQIIYPKFFWITGRNLYPSLSSDYREQIPRVSISEI